MSRHSQNSSRWLILSAILVGFGLRIYDPGGDSLWSDEAGQALAALHPTVIETVNYIRSHAGAMPMDYLVTGLFAQISTHEYGIRFPSLLWSTAAVAVLFALAKWMAGQQVATIAIWIMASAPHLVYYAQEARPYAALLFFSLLATYLLLRALDAGGVQRWLKWVVVMVVGTYFHLYTLLTAAYGGVFILLSAVRHCTNAGEHVVRPLLIFIGCLAGILVLLIPGYLFFISQDAYRYDLLEFGGTVWRVTVTGLGWPIHRYPSQATLLMFLTGVGIIGVLVRRRSERRLLTCLLGLPFIVAIIFLVDVINGYWYLPRQIIHLQPIVLIFTSIGCLFIGKQIVQRIPDRLVWQRYSPMGVAAIFLMIIFILGTPRLLDGYALPKGNGRIITQLLIEVANDDTIIYVNPEHEVRLYTYYANILSPSSSSRDALTAALRPATCNDALESVTESSHQYLIAPPSHVNPRLSQLHVAGYTPLLESPSNDGYLRSLWGRP
jgi:uncharacterized membrane protein